MELDTASGGSNFFSENVVKLHVGTPRWRVAPPPMEILDPPMTREHCFSSNVSSPSR